jgi:mono/diheme cytochrome c family protein
VTLAAIARHPTDRPLVSLDDPTLVRVRLDCANCHGAPGVEPAKFSEGPNPPPNLKKVVNVLLPGELFWVIKNGVKMTGMPSFGASGASDREIWTIVAFLKKLESVSDEDFKAWSGAPPGAR